MCKVIGWRGHLNTDAVAVLGSAQMEPAWQSEVGGWGGVQALSQAHCVVTPLLSLLQENAGLGWDGLQAPCTLWHLWFSSHSNVGCSNGAWCLGWSCALFPQWRLRQQFYWAQAELCQHNGADWLGPKSRPQRDIDSDRQTIKEGNWWLVDKTSVCWWYPWSSLQCNTWFNWSGQKCS